MSLGVWIKEKLIEAGSKGVVVADLHKERRANRDELRVERQVLYKGGTYHSLVRFFHWFKQLEWVEFTGREEVGIAKGTDEPINPASSRRYYRITDKGRRASDNQWSNPIEEAHPEQSSVGRYKRYGGYRKPTGRPRGRPYRVWVKPEMEEEGET